MSGEPLITTRETLRKESLKRRDAIPENMRDAYSHLIRKKLVAYLNQLHAKFVHIYIGFRSEVATYGIIEDLFEQKITVAVPCTSGNDNNEMKHSLLENLVDLRQGKFGVPEPAVIKDISLESLDAVIIPIVAFDIYGVRLGYGKGYYDKFLSTLGTKTRRVGLAFSQQELEKIPMMSHDELINEVITEQSHFFFK